MPSFPVIPGYTCVEQLHASSRTMVYRAVETETARSVIVKLLQQNRANINDLLQFRNQYAIAKKLDTPGIVRPNHLIPWGNSYALIFEDFNGISLKKYARERNLSIIEVLKIAIQLAQILHDLHQACIIHKDIKPVHILIAPETHKIKLIDFGIASLLPQKTTEIPNINLLEGTLAYIAPEQTGRMNRGLDYRADFYSMGVTLFELLTQQLPFKPDDPLELVHCHLAKNPARIDSISPEVSPAIADIIYKLMAKNAEDRYQTALGIKHDLEQCCQQLETNGNIESFEIGQKDLCDRFLIPEKLYGREQEVTQLLEAFERVSQGETEIMLVTGASGIGKTSVIRELHKPIVRQRGYFIGGKYDQFQRNIPFSAILQAFRALVEQLLSESDEKRAIWKNKILAAVGESGQILISVIPELENIIGKQPVAPELSDQASQSRFNLLFQRFFKIFTEKEHPLVLFLDDLQWADSASLDLLQTLIKNTEYLLVLGAYRDNEVTSLHPLTLALEESAKTGVVINTIKLQALSKLALYQLVSETLKSQDSFVGTLTQAIERKTQGNPFFATQFFKSLYDKQLVFFDRIKQRWQCQIAKVTALAVTENIVNFIAVQIQKLPVEIQKIFSFAACLGTQFDLKTLAIVSKRSPERVAKALWRALQENYVVPIGSASQFLALSESHEVLESSANLTYRFLHDRIQQAVYSLIPEDQKKSIHYEIGQILLQEISVESREDRIFELVNHLNYGIPFISQQVERERLARLNLRAAGKAKANTAYQAAREYVTTALSLLPENAWQQQYKLALELHELAAEIEMLCGEFEQIKKIIDIVEEKSSSTLDLAKLYECKIRVLASQNKLLEALNSGQQILERLGIIFPRSPSKINVLKEISEIQHLIGNRKVEDLVNLPLIADARQFAILRITIKVIPAAFNAASPLFVFLSCLAVKLLILNGNQVGLAHIYANYGIILLKFSKDVKLAVEFGQLALSISDKLNDIPVKPAVLTLLSLFLKHRNCHIKETLPLFQKVFITGLEIGDLAHIGYSSYGWFYASFASSQYLADWERDASRHTRELLQLNQLTVLNYCQICRQLVLNLQGSTEEPAILSGEAFFAKEVLPQLFAGNDLCGVHSFYLHQLILAFLFEENELAEQTAIKARQYLSAAEGLIIEPLFYFYDSLIALTALNPNSEDRTERLERVTQNQESLQHWADYAPMNHQHKVDLVTAEYFRVLGQKAEAFEFYERAILGAKVNEYIQEEALANQLAAKFYLDWSLDSARPNGKERVAAGYMQEAYFCYARWGAQAKMADLEKRYPQLLGAILQPSLALRARSPEEQVYKGSTITGTPGNSQLLDLSTIAQAFQSISSEIILDKLLAQLMTLLIENAGAQRGILILAEGDSLLIEAMGEMTATLEAKAVKSIPLEESENLPLSVIQYVQQTQSEVVIADARNEEQYCNDPYILKTQPQSILAAPILNQGKIVGIFYLENNLVTNAFTPARLEVLQILASQAAISLENARLYGTLEQKVEERTAQLATANEEITLLNQRLKQENLRMSAELDVVKELQEMVLPKTEELESVKDLDIAGFMEPADEIGGDYYDVLQDEDGVKIAIGDVTGHGLESGLLMMMAQTAVQTLQQSGERDPARFFDILNRTLYANIERLKAERSMTLATLDYREGEFCLSGQHEEVIIARASGEIEIIDTIALGFPLGLEEEISDFIAAESFTLQPGDALVLYSDGITEAENSEGELYGQQRLYDLLREHRALAAAEIRDAIVADVRQYIGTHKVWDDITLVVVKKRV